MGMRRLSVHHGEVAREAGHTRAVAESRDTERPHWGRNAALPCPGRPCGRSRRLRAAHCDRWPGAALQPDFSRDGRGCLRNKRRKAVGE